MKLKKLIVPVVAVSVLFAGIAIMQRCNRAPSGPAPEYTEINKELNDMRDSLKVQKSKTGFWKEQVQNPMQVTLAEHTEMLEQIRKDQENYYYSNRKRILELKEAKDTAVIEHDSILQLIKLFNQ